MTPLILSHILVFLLPFLLLLRASPSPDPAPAPAVVSLPARRPISHGQRPRASPVPEVEHDLLPFVLISTIDGALHAVNRENGGLLWSLKDGVEPLVAGSAKGDGTEEYIVEPLNGGLYAFEDADGEDKARVRKLPISVEELIDLSPFTFPHSPSRIFTGSKQTSLLTLDIRTGQQLDCFSPNSPNSSSDAEQICANDRLLDDMERSKPRRQDTLFVGRTDYRLMIHSPPNHMQGQSSTGLSGYEEGRSGTQEIVYSTYTPNSFDKPLAEYWSKVGAAARLYEEDGSESSKMRVELGHDGMVYGVELARGPRWRMELGSVGIGVYDILLPLTPGSANPILVPQPPSHFPALLSPTQQQEESISNRMRRAPSTYIASLPVTLPPISSREPTNDSHPRRDPNQQLLYALSSESYPLVNLAPPPMPGALTGSFVLSEDLPEHDKLLPYLLDPPIEEPTLLIEGEEAVSSRRSWIWWGLSVLGLLASLGPAAVGLHRRGLVKQSSSPLDEITPLLLPVTPKKDVLRSEKTVTIVEPKGDESEEKSGLGDDVDSTPKKKNGRRRVRGKKKPRDPDSGASKDLDEEEDESLGGSSSTPGREEKPLPELPRVVTVSDVPEMEDKEKLCISDNIIGFGSHGTVVLKGTWGGRPVAVKRLLSDFTRLASQEVKLLQASDDHQNVIRYYCQERRENFLYIALDLCQASLADLIESPDKHLELASALDRKKALVQVTSGVKHLHSMKIIHRDIKPQNVLVSVNKDKSLRILVSDFGLARRLEQDQSSFAPTANNLAGSLGWRAPECIRGQVKLTDPFDPASSNSSSSTSSSSASLLDLGTESEDKEVTRGRGHDRLTKAVDLFALGCLYFWVLMSGEHPYGEVYDRESNIVKGEAVNMSQLDILGEEGWEAKELIGRMLAMDPESRPETSACLTHPFFWTPAKRLAFLCDASDRFEIMELEPPEPTLVMLETNAQDVVGKDWYSRLDKVFINNLGKYRKYKGSSVRDLLRAMRNKKHHYQDLEPVVKRHLGSLPSGFLHYFTSRYPALFLHVHSVVRDGRLRHESMFEGYFQEGG